jgi:hypothetical protein
MAERMGGLPCGLATRPASKSNRIRIGRAIFRVVSGQSITASLIRSKGIDPT